MQAKLKVLIAEDNSMIADLVKEILDQHGFEVCGIARTVNEAVAIGLLHKPDLALIDFGLAKGGLGTEVAIQLRANGRFGILYTTGNSWQASMVNADGDACLDKPFGWNDLLRALEIVTDIVVTGTATPPFPPGFHVLSRANLNHAEAFLG